MSPITTHVHAPRTLDSTQIGETTRACCGKTVLLVRKTDTGFNTAEEGCEVRAAAALQA